MSFKELIEKFPNSTYAADAQARLRFLLNTLAGSEIQVARFYMRRGAYLAAANRAQYAVQNYPQAPAIEEAVFVMVKAYDALGMTDLRDAADRVTIDIAAIGSPSWVFERANKGDALEYDSPQYKFFETSFKNGLGKPNVLARPARHVRRSRA